MKTRRNGRVDNMALKLDISKAYDVMEFPCRNNGKFGIWIEVGAISGAMCFFNSFLCASEW